MTAMIQKLLVRLAAVAAFMAASPASSRAEISPAGYNQLRADAKEVLIIEVTKWQTTAVNGPNTVTVTAKVLYAEKSDSNLKAGAVITIEYITPAPGVIGPKPPDPLKASDVRVVYLNKGAKNYEIVAHGNSFKAEIFPMPGPK
jgi:hypothetical protein